MSRPSKKARRSTAKPRRSSRPDPFRLHDDHHNNACVDNYMAFHDLSRRYRDSADALVKCTADNRSTLDVHIYAICFLYRHSLELLLKELFWQSGYALNGDKGLQTHHRLGTLWGQVEKRGRELLGTDFPLTAKEAASVKQLFADFEEHDPESDAFRYPVNKKKQRTHPSLTNVNVRVLQEAVHEVSELLGRLLCLVDYHYWQRSEMEREYSG